MGREKPCRWKCGRRTDRRCGICLDCCDARDQRNKRIDAELEAYVPPSKRPEHRLYEGKPKRPVTDKQRAAIAKARAVKSGVSTVQNAQGEPQPARMDGNE